MKRLNIDYEINNDCFLDIKNVSSELIWGDLNAVREPWFSYILPVYKRADLLEETIQSILNQKNVDFCWDIVIVDNEAGGENETERLIRKIDDKRILYYRNKENLGPDGNYNRCIELARGKWLAMLHGDDLIIDDHLLRMGAYIKKKEWGWKPLAYISVSYKDFKEKSRIHLHREDIEELIVVYRNKLKRMRQLDVLITGYSVGLPSFGTVMNKDVMIRTGGFNEKLGICEDVITPYKLMKKYRVYVTPEMMGYHRFEGNESIKTATIFKICEAMTDFREYVFSKNLFSKVWGNIARTPFFDLLTEYCSYLSGFTEKRLKKSDFDYIYPERKDMTLLDRMIFDVIERTYCLITGAVTYEEGIELSVNNKIDDIKKMAEGCGMLIIYGAGRAGRCASNILKKKFGIQTDFFAVTECYNHEQMVEKIPVRRIADLKEYKNGFVLIATSVPEYFDEMIQHLKEEGFTNYLPLDDRFKRGEGEYV